MKLMTIGTLVAAPAVLVLSVLALVALGSGRDSHQDDRSAPGNAVDAAFIAAMAPHHEQALAMVRLADEQAEHAEIRALAAGMAAGQEREIEEMQAIDREMERIGGDAQLRGDPSEVHGDAADLDGAQPFDRAFIDAMVPHHAGAIALARGELADGVHPMLRELAEAVIDAQSTEIARMKKLRKAWYGVGEVPSSRDHHLHAHE